MKTILWIVGIPVILLLLIILLLQIPAVQRKVTSKATAFVSEKTGTKVTLGKLSIAFPKAIAVEDLYVEDLHQDTLLYLHDLRLDIALMQLLHHKIAVDRLSLQTLTAHVSRPASDSTFNFSFLIDAFAKPGKQDLPEEPADSSQAWQIDVGTVELHDIIASYHDAYSGTFADLKLGNLVVDVNALDLASKSIDVKRISLDNTFAAYTQKISHQPPKASTESAPFDYQLKLEQLQLDGITALYHNTIQDKQAALALGHLLIKPKTIDLAHERIDLESIALSKTTVRYNAGNAPAKADTKTDEQPKTGVDNSSNWTVTVKQLALDSNRLHYDNKGAARQAKGLDYNHLFADNFCLHASNIYGNAKASSLSLETLSFQEQCGFGIKNFRGELVYDTAHVSLSQLYLETNESVIRDHLSLRYKSLADIGTHVGELYASVQLRDTELKLRDVLYFVPNLTTIEALKITPETSLRLNIDAQGIINDLAIKRFDVFTPKQTIARFRGRIRQVLQPDRLYLDLEDIHLSSTKNDLLSILNPSLIPQTINLPETFAVSGTLNGYLKNFNTALHVQTSIGNVLAKIEMNPPAGNIEQPYKALVKVEHFDAGKLLGQPESIGQISATATAKGSGLSPETIHTTIGLSLEKARLNGYDYTNLDVKGELIKRSFTGTAVMNDPNLAFAFDGSLNFDSAAPRYAFTFDLTGADLKALQLSTEDMRLSTHIRSDLRQQGDNISGLARIDNTLLIRNKKRIPVDSIVLISKTSGEQTEISLQSEIVEAGLKGTLHMSDLGASLQQFINNYYELPGPKPKQTNKNQAFDFQLHLRNPRFIADNFVPQLDEISPVSIEGSYNATGKSLKAELSMPHMLYAGTRADSLHVIINSDATALKFYLTTAEVSNPTIKIENASLSGEAANNVMNFRLATAKDDSMKLLALGASLKKTDTGHELHLEPQLTLNAQEWSINPSNQLRLLTNGIVARDLNLNYGSQAIRINSVSDLPDAPLQIDFTKFDLSTISDILKNKTNLLKGEMNGTVRLEKHQQSDAFSSDLLIRDFAFQDVAIGTVTLKADNRIDPSLYNMAMTVKGNGNDLDVNGQYRTNDKQNALNFDLNVHTLKLKTIEPFTFGQVTRLSGSAEGKLKIRGSVDAPELNGNLHFQDAALNPKFIDSYLKIPDGNLSFADRKLILQNFTILDSLDNKASLDGSVSMKDLKNPGLDLRLRSDNFLALNTTKQDNPLYFGTIFLDSDIRIRGDVNTPQVKARIRLNNGSEITYIKPESQVGKAENKGIVEFVDSLNTRKNIMTRETDTTDQITMMKGIDLDASITFDKSVQLKMLVDQQSGDSLYIVGGGTLNFILDQSGKTTLTGKYRIDDGGYHLTISEVVKRDFRIEPGSSVTWSGDILDAYVDIKAIYTIKTSPIDLIQNDLAGVDELERNKYRNMLTFLVYLKMTGFLSAPEISFDIQLAPKDKGAVNGTVNAKLEELRGDETQLNKQVFALLTLRRFISDNPLDNGGGGGGLSSASRTSASKILTQQLNSLSQKYVKGVDLDLGVNSFEDYSTGQEQGRTQLQIGVSKQLFKDKVTIRVGGNVELEGERAKQNNASDVAGNISIDYKLTDDGRYKLRGFRQNQYENPIEGEITKTGVGVVYVRNYNRLKDLFRKPKQTKKNQEMKTK